VIDTFTVGNGVCAIASIPPTLATIVKLELVGCHIASYRAGRERNSSHRFA
jgi:hypothetical protein